jgi:hypothetical protein
VPFWDMDIQFTIKQGNKEFDFSLPFNKLKITGVLMQDRPTTCYIPIFHHGMTGIRDLNVIYVGNIFLEDYYLIYDMSPLEDHGKDYIQIAMGHKNPEN